MQIIFFSEHLPVVGFVDFKLLNFEVLLKMETTTLKTSEKQIVLKIVKSKSTLLNISIGSQRNNCDGGCFSQVAGF